MTTPEDDPMFGGIVRGSQEWNRKQQEEAERRRQAETNK